jgi:hypothetical protein
MQMTQRKDKKLVYVNYDLLEEVTKASKSRGETITKFVEESLAQAVRVTTAGYDIKQLGEFFEVMYAQRILGGAFVPLEVLTFLTNQACKDDKDQLSKVWFDSGKWHGKYLKERFDDPIQAMKSFLSASRWDLSEVEVKGDAHKVKVRCVSTILNQEGTFLLAKFIEGILNGVGYRVEKGDCLKGMIVLEFVK